MTDRLRSHAALCISLVALFIALGGTSWAAINAGSTPSEPQAHAAGPPVTASVRYWADITGSRVVASRPQARFKGSDGDGLVSWGHRSLRGCFALTTPHGNTPDVTVNAYIRRGGIDVLPNTTPGQGTIIGYAIAVFC